MYCIPQMSEVWKSEQEYDHLPEKEAEADQNWLLHFPNQYVLYAYKNCLILSKFDVSALMAGLPDCQYLEPVVTLSLDWTSRILVRT